MGCCPGSQGLLLHADDRAEKGEEKDPSVVTPSDETPAEDDHLGPNCYYDKSKSFFDNISSELKTRSVGWHGWEGCQGWGLRASGLSAHGHSGPSGAGAAGDGRGLVPEGPTQSSRHFLLSLLPSSGDHGGLRCLLPEASGPCSVQAVLSRLLGTRDPVTSFVLSM